MKELFLIIIFFHFGFILNMDIDIKGDKGLYNLTSGETYNFYSPVVQMGTVYIYFNFVNFTYAPFDCIYINEYSSRNGTSLRKETIKNIEYYKSEEYYEYCITYNFENFSSTYISFSFKSNLTIENVLIELYIYGGLFNLSNGIAKKFEDLFEDESYYLAIPVCNSKIKVELNSTYYVGLEDIVLTIIEYQKNNSDYYIYEKRNQNYTIDYNSRKKIKTISFNYVIKNNNTNFFCLKIQVDDYISYLNVSLSEDRYYFNIYDKKSLDIFDLKPNQTYHFSLEAKTNNLITINYNIFSQDFNDTQLPLESIIIYEDKSEFSFDYRSRNIQYIKNLSESFLYPVSQSNTKYLSLNITPKFQIEKFTIAYNITKEIKTIYNLQSNVLFSLPEIYPYIEYKFNINSKILEVLEYEIIASSQPSLYISLIENPSEASHDDALSFKKDGNAFKANSSLKNTHCDTQYSTFLIKSYNYIELFSIKVNVIVDRFYYLTENVNRNIEHFLANKDYYFAIKFNGNSNKYNIYINIKYTSKEKIEPFLTMYYYLESNTEFKFPFRFDDNIFFSQKGNEFYSTVNFAFNDNFDILLLQIPSKYNLDNFNIDYKLEDKINSITNGKNNTLLYILLPLGIIVFLCLLFGIIRSFCIKNKNSNLINDTIDIKANLMPEETQEIQEIQESHEKNNQ